MNRWYRVIQSLKIPGAHVRKLPGRWLWAIFVPTEDGERIERTIFLKTADALQKRGVLVWVGMKPDRKLVLADKYRGE